MAKMIKGIKELYYRVVKGTKGNGTWGNYALRISVHGEVELRHYGTLIYHSKRQNTLVSLGGYSASDRDAIDTMLAIDRNIVTPMHVTSSDTTAKRYKGKVIGKMGGWYVLQGQ